MLAEIVQLAVPAKRASHVIENEPLHHPQPPLLFHNTDRKMFDSRWHRRGAKKRLDLNQINQRKKRPNPEIELFRQEATGADPEGSGEGR